MLVERLMASNNPGARGTRVRIFVVPGKRAIDATTRYRKCIPLARADEDRAAGEDNKAVSLTCDDHCQSALSFHSSSVRTWVS